MPDVQTFPDQQDIPPMPVMAAPPTPTPPPSDSNVLDIPPIIAGSSSPKGRRGKIIATILGILLLVGAVGAGVVLVGQKQLFRQKAACTSSGCGTITSPCCFGSIYEPSCPAPYQKCTAATPTPTPSTCITDGVCLVSGQSCCNGSHYDNNCSTQVRCGGGTPTSPPSCITDGVCLVSGQSCCNGSHYDNNCSTQVRCGGGTPTTPPGATPTPTPNSCSLTGNRICVGNDVTGPCYQGGQGGEYACYKLTGNRGRMVAGTGTQCVHTGGSSSDCICDTSPYLWKAFENGATWCFDTRTTCDGEGCYAERCSLQPQQCTGATPTPTPPGATPTPTPTPTGTPPAPMCTTIKAYDTSWNPLSQAQLSALKPGNKVRFTISGTPADKIDKARFTINGVLGTEITTKKPGTNEYYVEYTIPTGVTSFTVTAQIHHLTLGWF